MATSVNPAIANNIGLAESYLPILDGLYKDESKSLILDTAQDRVRFDADTHTFYLFETDMVGLGNYSRNDGFVRGDVTSGWRAYAPQWDRGRQFNVDVADNMETFDMAFGTLAGEFMRLKVVPEVDAVRFATYATGAAADNKVNAALTTSEAVMAAIDDATEALDNKEVPYEGRLLFVNPSIYRLIKGGVTRFVENGEKDINYNVLRYNDMRLITVPKPRFNTQVTLAAPTEHSDAGGYTPSGNNINFMIIHPTAVMQASKLMMPRIFSPQVNQQAVGWLYDYRQYHGAWVKHQKADGIYVHSAPVVSG